MVGINHEIPSEAQLPYLRKTDQKDHINSQSHSYSCFYKPLMNISGYLKLKAHYRVWGRTKEILIEVGFLAEGLPAAQGEPACLPAF